MDGLVKKLEESLRLKNYSSQTIKSYLFCVEKYLKFSSDKGINQESAKEFILKELTLKNPSSVSHNVFVLKYFFKEILKQPLDLPNPKRNKTLPDILTIGEIRKLIEVNSNIKHLLIIKLLYGCGLRVSEIITLENKDLNFEEGLIKINLAKGKKD